MSNKIYLCDFDIMENLECFAKEIDMNISELENNFNIMCERSRETREQCFEQIYNYYSKFGALKLRELFALNI